jgi:hypothetical protein
MNQALGIYYNQQPNLTPNKISTPTLRIYWLSYDFLDQLILI